MTRPTISDAAERLVRFIGEDILTPDETHGWTFTLLLDVLAVNHETFEEIFRARDGRPGFAGFLDPDACPTVQLPALAMWAGATVTPAMTDDEMRARIIDRPARRRGSPGRIAAAVAVTLTGGRWVDIIERDGGPYQITVRTYTSQTPEPTAAAAAAAVAAPWWILTSHQLVAGQTWGSAQQKYATWGDAQAAYPTWGDALEDI